MAKRKGLWGKFDEVMEELPKYIAGEIEAAENSVNTIGDNNVVMNGNSSVRQTSVFGSSKSVIVQGGNKVVIKTKNGKTTVTVNGKEYVPKEK